MIVHFSGASIPPSVRSSIHPFLQIILVLNLQCAMHNAHVIESFSSPNQQRRPLPSLLSDSASMNGT